MGGKLIRRVFRTHHGVAQLATKCRGLSELVGFIAARGAYHDEHDQERRERQHGAALGAVVEIDAGIEGARSDFFPPFHQFARQHKQQAENQECGRNHVGQDPDIGAGLNGDGINQDKDKNIGQADDRQRNACQADRVAQQHARTVPRLLLGRGRLLSVHGEFR